MGEKNFRKFMQTLSHILEITGDVVVCFNRIPGDVIMVSSKVTAVNNVSYKHRNPDSLAVGEGIFVNVGWRDGGEFERILKNAYEKNEFRFDYPEKVLERLKPEDLDVSSEQFQEFIGELRKVLIDRDIQSFFVTREGESYITLHDTKPKNKTLLSPAESGIKEIQGNRVVMELDKRVIDHDVFQKDLHHFWRHGLVNAPFMDDKLDSQQKISKEKSVTVHGEVESFGTIVSRDPNMNEFKINTQQAHRMVTFFAPEVTLEEVQKLIEIIKLEEVRK